MPINIAYLNFGWVLNKGLLALGDLHQLLAVNQLWNGNIGLLNGQPDHGQQIGHDQHNVLGDLRPRDSTHTAQERAHQNSTQTQKHPQLKSHTSQARGDEAHPINLGHQIHKGAQNGSGNPHQAGPEPAIALTQKVGNGVLAKPSQIRSQKQRHQTIAARPPHDKGQTVVPLQVNGARQTNKRCGRHPVGARSHAVVHGRHPAPRHVVFHRVSGAAHDAHKGVDPNGGEQKNKANPWTGQAQLLKHRQQGDKDEKASCVPLEQLVELAAKSRILMRRHDAAGDVDRLDGSSGGHKPPQWPNKPR